jgi:putative ABC transport system permease protein
MTPQSQRPTLATAIGRDFATAARSLRRAPRHVVLVATCFALGLGANVAMFGVVDTLFRAPPPLVRESGQLFRVYFERHLPTGESRLLDLESYPSYLALRANTSSFVDVAAFYPTIVSEGVGPSARQLRVQLVSANFFSMLGARPSVGRAIVPSDGVSDAQPVAVVSERFLAARGGAVRGGAEGSLLIEGRRYAIVGVMPGAFRGVDLEDVDAWLPLETTGNDLILPGYLQARGAWAIRMVARIKTGISLPRADADLTRAFRVFMEWNPHINRADRALVAPLLKNLGPAEGVDAKVSVWLAYLSLAVVLIAAVNCAMLLLLRVSRRRGELAVRRALGASASAIARLLLLETALTMAIATAVGAGVAMIATAALHKLLLPANVSPAAESWPRMAAYAFGVALVAGILVSLPAMRLATRLDVTAYLRDGARAGKTSGLRLRRGFLVAQVALTTVLLVGAALFVSSLHNVQALDLGFRDQNVLLANIGFQGMGVRPGSAGASAALFDEVERSARSVPGVVATGVSTSVPFQYLFGAVLSVPGRDPALPIPPTTLVVASAGYGDAIGLRPLAGRWFSRSDYGAVNAVGTTAVINETLARALWPGESAVGKCIVPVEPPCRRIVGVVADTRRSDILEAPRGQLYLTAVDSETDHRMLRTLVVKTDGRRGVARALQRAVQSVSAALPYVTVQPLDDLVAPKRRAWQVGATVLTIFGALALVLASLGLYATLSSSVSERSHEIGVRMALGARDRQIAAAVLGRTLVVVFVGLVCGAGIAWAGGSIVNSLLFGVTSNDRSAFALAGATLASAALVASIIPLRSALRTNIVEVLRRV